MVTRYKQGEKGSVRLYRKFADNYMLLFVDLSMQICTRERERLYIIDIYIDVCTLLQAFWTESAAGNLVRRLGSLHRVLILKVSGGLGWLAGV